MGLDHPILKSALIESLRFIMRLFKPRIFIPRDAVRLEEGNEISLTPFGRFEDMSAVPDVQFERSWELQSPPQRGTEIQVLIRYIEEEGP